MNKTSKKIISQKKRRAFFKLAILIIGISAFLPSSFLGTNLLDYKDNNSRDMAKQVIKMTTDTFNNSLDQLLIVSYEIESLEEDDGELISSVVIAYTVFGVPYAEIIANKDGAYINKKFFFDR
ncbi:hypothetical protein PB01_07865 [Psychrobacillus glaciei]|uniref:Uncharacterized protein n=1 Tax=Psychrobacillus glaciei TaxID=2283160 RepID=A0A5J6SMT2_9BACI|nr:hypothetical protein [Psychrobacillus glaciei]QFF98753.1 hypothetical protein PB01_07865 [Psychrobacillus glaciei]